MRLIDADAFEKFIEEKYKDGESTDDIKDQFLFDLSYQPTAYDVEKVVKQEEDFLVNYGIPKNTPVHRKIIDIVRNGGVK